LSSARAGKQQQNNATTDVPLPVGQAYRQGTDGANCCNGVDHLYDEQVVKQFVLRGAAAWLHNIDHDISHDGYVGRFHEHGLFCVTRLLQPAGQAVPQPAHQPLIAHSTLPPAKAIVGRLKSNWLQSAVAGYVAAATNRTRRSSQSELLSRPPEYCVQAMQATQKAVKLQLVAEHTWWGLYCCPAP
jgi:hypothetical protein